MGIICRGWAKPMPLAIVLEPVATMAIGKGVLVKDAKFFWVVRYVVRGLRSQNKNIWGTINGHGQAIGD